MDALAYKKLAKDFDDYERRFVAIVCAAAIEQYGNEVIFVNISTSSFYQEGRDPQHEIVKYAKRYDLLLKHTIDESVACVYYTVNCGGESKPDCFLFRFASIGDLIVLRAIVQDCKMHDADRHRTNRLTVPIPISYYNTPTILEAFVSKWQRWKYPLMFKQPTAKVFRALVAKNEKYVPITIEWGPIRTPNDDQEPGPILDDLPENEFT
jgi:hypothetical protein